jgi:hypothetical protein
MEDDGYRRCTWGEGVDHSLISSNAAAYETFCKAARKEFRAAPGNLPPVGAWDGNVWFNQIERLEQRWKQHIEKLAKEWWLERGLAATFVAGGALHFEVAGQDHPAAPSSGSIRPFA